MSSKPLPRKQRVLNRGFLYTRTGDDVSDLSVNLIDIDSSILYYFKILYNLQSKIMVKMSKYQ